MTRRIENIDLQREIDLSVLTWCSEHDPADAVFHGALIDEWNPTDEELELGWRNFFDMEGRRPRHLAQIVFRKPTWDHIPADQGRRAAPTRSLPATGLLFQPFEHYRYRRHRPVCVLRSHWIGPVRGGRFRSAPEEKGKMTESLGSMIAILAEKFGEKHGWRGYTNLDEMKADARLALIGGLLKFSPIRSSNPFAYATQCMQNAFIANLNSSKNVWNHERHMGSAEVSEDGDGFDVREEESWADAADREFSAGKKAFDRSPSG